MNKIKTYSILVLSVISTSIGLGFVINSNQNLNNINQREIASNAYIKNIEYGENFGGATAEVDGQDKLYMWGYNGLGQLGTGNYTNSSTPQLVYTAPVGSTIDLLSLGKNHSGMVVNDGTKDYLYMWGNNTYGETGISGASSYQNTIALQGEYDDIVDLSLGRNNSYMIVNNETDNKSEAYSWGRNSSGILGNGSASTGNSSPNKVLETDKDEIVLKNIEVGWYTAYISGTDVSSNTDVVYASGSNNTGQMARPMQNPSTITSFTQGTGSLNAPSGSQILEINASYATFYETLYNPSTGNYTLRAVGFNANGELADGTTTSKSSWVTIFSGTDKITLAKSDAFTAGAVIETDTEFKLYTWGYNGAGGVGGENLYANKYTTPQLILNGNLDQGTVVDITFNTYSIMVLEQNISSSGTVTQELSSAGRNSYGQLGTGGPATPTNYGLRTIVKTTSTITPDIKDNKIIVDENSITKNSFEFSIEISDPSSVFDPDKLVLWSNGKALNTTYVEEVSEGVYKYKVDGLDPATTYDNLEIQPHKDNSAKIEVEGTATTKTPTNISLTDVTLEEGSVGKETASFNVDLAFNDYTFDDVNSVNYTLLNATDPDATEESGTANLLEDNGNYSFTITGLEAGTDYELSDVFINFDKYDSSEQETNKLYENENLTFSTTSMLNPTLNSATLNGDSVNEKKAQIDLDLDFNDYEIDDINNVHYTLTDQSTDTSMDKTASLAYDPSRATGYYFIINDLNDATNYSVSNIYLTFNDNKGDEQQTNALNAGENEQIDFNTDAINGEIDSISITKVDQNSVTFKIKYSGLGSFNAEDVMVTYKVNGKEITEPVNPEYIRETSPGVYEYKITNLSPWTTYSDFKFYLPSGVDSQNQNIYDYTASDFSSAAKVLTDKGTTLINGGYGLKIDDRSQERVKFSVKFDQIGASLEYIQAGYNVNGKTVMPTSDSPTLRYVGENPDGSHQFELINLTKNTDYKNLILYLPSDFITDPEGNLVPVYGEGSEVLYKYNTTISTVTFSPVSIFFIVLGGAIAILLFWWVSYEIGKSRREN